MFSKYIEARDGGWAQHMIIFQIGFQPAKPLNNHLWPFYSHLCILLPDLTFDNLILFDTWPNIDFETTSLSGTKQGFRVLTPDESITSKFQTEANNGDQLKEIQQLNVRFFLFKNLNQNIIAMWENTIPQ